MHILCKLGFHKLVGPHYHKDSDIFTCDGGCRCVRCDYKYGYYESLAQDGGGEINK